MGVGWVGLDWAGFQRPHIKNNNRDGLSRWGCMGPEGLPSPLQELEGRVQSALNF